MNILDKELKIVDLDGTEKTWIGGVKDFIFRGEIEVYYTRCVRAEDVSGREVKTVTLADTNGSYRPRYWTNLPPFWDNHAVVSEAPETVFKYEYCKDAFEDEDILEAWLDEDAGNTWDDGFTEWGPGEFDSRCRESVNSWMRDTEEISFEEWLITEPEEDED